jgi:hypothetical protein
MARKRSTEGVREYFRQLFAKHPDWLWERSNELVLEQWRRDHPGKEATERVKDGMANVKSLLRRDARGGKSGAATRPAARPGRSARTASLEQLEASIDGVLLMARACESEEMDSVIRHLRRARNGVVMELGEPGKD